MKQVKKKYYSFINWIIPLAKDLYFRFNDDDVPALASQLAYYFILALFPFLIFLINLISFTPITSEQALNDLSKVIPNIAYDIIKKVIDQTSHANRQTFLSFSMVAALWAASNGMNAVIKSLNKAYDRHETRSLWKVRLLSIIATIAFAFTIILSFFLLILGEVIGKSIFVFLGLSNSFKTLWSCIRFMSPAAIMIIVFALLYRYMPNRRMKYSEVLAGSIFSTVGWLIISVLFSIYVNNFSNYANTYGSIGGIILLIIWLYWISIIILLGGELNAALAYNRAKRKNKTS
ncbi:YihY/virulence factor BrkB family protein [Acetivibrio clariflavus]|uniref:Putative membrane protein n=1 Tax=Acetivibrio clariflavus (strain DSM 19732 / NBRC 101661 / EBR45) TaxID=720554 RepID=G8LTQ2_ACECE|nr:YihY/virulence factor BrkB family protein [Acetivibrio clariflavus]AEV70562.1 putative membrane protein [Acetivibrio clariflavus DSM 19732]